MQEGALSLLLDVLVLDVAELVLLSVHHTSEMKGRCLGELVTFLSRAHLLLVVTFLYQGGVEKRLQIDRLAGAVNCALAECYGVEGEGCGVGGDFEEPDVSWTRARERRRGAQKLTRLWCRIALHGLGGRPRIRETWWCGGCCCGQRLVAIVYKSVASGTKRGLIRWGK